LARDDLAEETALIEERRASLVGSQVVGVLPAVTDQAPVREPSSVWLDPPQITAERRT